jgi:hypothetical protein
MHTACRTEALTLHLLLCLLPGCQSACPLPSQLAKASCFIIVIRDLRPMAQHARLRQHYMMTSGCTSTFGAPTASMNNCWQLRS